jgi:hypothetical protein
LRSGHDPSHVYCSRNLLRALSAGGVAGTCRHIPDEDPGLVLIAPGARKVFLAVFKQVAPALVLGPVVLQED